MFHHPWWGLAYLRLLFSFQLFGDCRFDGAILALSGQDQKRLTMYAQAAGLPRELSSVLQMVCSASHKNIWTTEEGEQFSIIVQLQSMCLCLFLFLAIAGIAAN